MKYYACALLFFVNFVLSNHIIADKTQRIGRFNHEDSFDENLVEEVLKHSPAVVKKYIKKLLYLDPDDDEFPEQILLLGETSKISITAIAKAMALRCGYDYYVIEASALLQAYYDGKQRLLAEAVSIRDQVRPIALIITELPELVEHSRLLEIITWRLISKCTFMSDILLIGTSQLQKNELPQDIIDEFDDDIIELNLDQAAQERIEKIVSKKNWMKKNKITCFVAAGLLCGVCAAGYLFAQMLFGIQRLQQLKFAKELLKQEVNNLSREINSMGDVGVIQSKLGAMQQQLNTLEEEKARYQRYVDSMSQQEEAKVEDDENDPISLNYWGDEDEEDFG